MLSNLPSTVKYVIVWSDGPASHFKNQYMANAMKHDVSFKWKLFAAGHGKVDGIGGAVNLSIKLCI